jgi:hypothetical protein
MSKEKPTAQELGFVLPPDNTNKFRRYKCKGCNTDGFVWMQKPDGTKGRWRLFTTSGFLHSCKPNDSTLAKILKPVEPKAVEPKVAWKPDENYRAIKL